MHSIPEIHCESESCSVVSDSLQSCGLQSPWNSPGQNTGVGSLSLLQGIFPTQGSNPGLPHCRQILYQLSHEGSPGILEWVAYPFSRGSSWPENQTTISCIAGGFFTNWAIREVQCGHLIRDGAKRQWVFPSIRIASNLPHPSYPTCQMLYVIKASDRFESLLSNFPNTYSLISKWG